MTFNQYMQYNKYLCSKLKIEQNSMDRTVIHLEIKGVGHFYFGSLAAIYTQFKNDEIGIGYGSLRNCKLSEGNPYENAKCTIRKGVLKTIEGGRGKKKDDVE